MVDLVYINNYPSNVNDLIMNTIEYKFMNTYFHLQKKFLQSLFVDTIILDIYSWYFYHTVIVRYFEDPLKPDFKSVIDQTSCLYIIR